MTRKKRERIADTKAMPNVLEYPDNMPGRWRYHFGREGSRTLELGCGKGEYVVTLAHHYPDHQFIGVDIKGERLWVGAKQALDMALSNAAFLRIPIEALTQYFAPGEVQNIWLTFPDPFPKPSKAKRRMISSRFLNLYEQVLRPGGFVHLKTDYADLFEFGLETAEAEANWVCRNYTRDLYQSSLLNAFTGIPTYYENLARQEGKTIKYAAFEF